MQTVFAFPLPSCRLAPPLVQPLLAPPPVRDVSKVGGRAVFSPFRAPFAPPSLVRKRGVQSDAEKYAPALSSLAPTQVEEDNERRTRRRSLPWSCPRLCINGGLVCAPTGPGNAGARHKTPPLTIQARTGGR